MKIIGLTGPTGAGKGEVSRIWKELGAEVIDCDALYHGMLYDDAALKSELAEAFPNCTDDAGIIDRRRLAGVVFSDKTKLSLLEDIAYRHIRRRIAEILQENREQGIKVTVLDAPTLFEAGADALCGVRTAVLAPMEVRRARLRIRDGLDDAAINARIAAQKTDDFFREHCEHILYNDAGIEDLRRAAEELYCSF